LAVVSVLAVLLLLLGSYLLSRGLLLWDAGLFVVLSLIVLSIAYAREDVGRRRWGGWLRSLLPEDNTARGVTWMRAGALLVSFAVAMLARAYPLDADFTPLFILWLLAVVGFVVSLCVPLGTFFRLGRDVLPAARRHAGVLAAAPGFWLLGLLVLAGALLRVVALGRVPGNLGGDEGTQLALALRLVGREGARAGMGNPFATGWFSVPTMSFAVYGLAMRVFGATMVGGRALSALVGGLTVLTTWALGWVVGGRRTGWLAAAIMAVSAYHIHYSRLASNQIFDPLIGTVALGWVWVALHPSSVQLRGLFWSRIPARTLSHTAWGLAGVTAGLGWYAYFGARWVSFLIAAMLGLWYLADPSLIRRHFRGFLLLGLGWMVVALPLLGWYTLNPSASSERYEAVSVFASGWLAREVEITGRSALQLMLQQLWRAATAFHLTPDPTFWYRPGRPLVDFVTGALLLLGMVDAGFRVRWPSRKLILLWFWSTLAMAWVMTENPPSSQRGLLLMPAAAILASWGLERIGAFLKLDGKRFVLLAVSVLVVIAGLNVGFYFGDYAPRRVYGNPTAELTTELAHYMLANPEPVCPSDPDRPCEGYVYMLGPPHVYWDFGTLAFMLRRFPGESVPPETTLDWATGPARFVVVPERLAELEMLRDLYPGGTETALPGVNRNPLVLIYDWP
jgi:hypothetical protein